MEPAGAAREPGAAAESGADVARASPRAAGSPPIEVLLRLNRAVQRATVYPPGHPSVRTAALSFWRTLSGALGEHPVLAVGVTHDGLLIDEQPLPRAQEALSWLARRLYDRHLAALVFAGGVSEEDAQSLIGWLADSAESEDLPALGSILLTRVDYSRATFDEERRHPGEDAGDPARTWRSVLAGLAAGWYDGDASLLADDPALFATQVCDEIQRNEGVGAAALVQAMASAGARLPRLAEPARTVVKSRLATLASALSPDVREQLLRVDARTSTRRLDALADLADALPDTLLMDLLADLDTREARLSGSFLNLMNKLIGLSVRDPDMRELAETKLVSLGLPRGLTLMDPSRAREMLEGMLVQESREWNPADYQATLDDLSERSVAPARALGRYEDVSHRDLVAEHTLEIVLRLLVTLPDHPDAPEYARRLRDDAPRALEAGRFALLREVATSMRDLLVLRQYLPAEVLGAAEDYLALLREPAAIERILDAIEITDTVQHRDLADLLRLSGTDGAVAGFGRLAQADDEIARERLSARLATLRPDTMADAVARLRQQGGTPLRALFLVLSRPETPGRLECALTFVGNRDAEIRRLALTLLIDADQRPEQTQRFLERALADVDPTVQQLGIERIEAIGGTVALDAIEALFLLDHSDRGTAGLASRLRAVELLGRLAPDHARRALTSQVHARRFDLRPSEIRLAEAIAARLVLDDHDEARAAVRAWRVSPAGLWARVLRAVGTLRSRERHA